MIDIDHFKCVNDNFGHHVGDIVLKTFVEKLKQSTGMNVIRYGGEEFMLISNSPDELYKKIEKSREEISKIIFITDKKEFSVNFSSGIGKTPVEADEFLYLAKNLGRGQTQLSPEIENLIISKRIDSIKIENDFFLDFDYSDSYSR